MNGIEKVCEPVGEEIQEAIDAVFPERQVAAPPVGQLGPAQWGLEPPTREFKIEHTALRWLDSKVQGRLPQNHEIEIALEGAKHFYDQLDRMMAGEAKEEA